MKKIKLLELEYQDMNPDTIQIAWREYIYPLMHVLSDNMTHEAKALFMQQALYHWLGLLQVARAFDRSDKKEFCDVKKQVVEYLIKCCELRKAPRLEDIL